jgi:hypothetical protein
MTEISLELAFLNDKGTNATSAVIVIFRTDDTNTYAIQGKTDTLTPPI